MSEGQSPAIVEVPSRILTREGKTPIRVPEILGWIEKNGEDFQTVLGSFDAVVSDFNLRKVDQVDQSYINFHMVRGILGEQKLPKVEELLAETGDQPARSYIRTIRELRGMMFRGQEPEGQREEPYVAYHQKPTDVRNLVVASVFHTYEELIKKRDGFKDKDFEPDRIIEGLMEIASDHKEDGLFDALASKEGMNWVDEYDRFSPEFRREHGYN